MQLQTHDAKNSKPSCLFRAFADQIYGDESLHPLMREQCVDFMKKNPDDFAPFLEVEILLLCFLFQSF